MSLNTALPVIWFLLQTFSSLPDADRPGNNTTLTMSDDGLYDIYGPLKLNEFPFLPVILGAIVCICLLALLLYLRRRKRPGSIPLSAGTIALAELKAIETLIDQPLMYMEKIDDILRRYLETRFAIASINRTTGELIFSLSQGNFSADAQMIDPYACDLAACLECTDLAKFAHLPPDRPGMLDIESTVRNFIEQTGRSQNGGGKS